MNSHSEFNKCYIPRLVVEENEARVERLLREEQEMNELLSRLEREDMSWEERKKLDNE